MTVLTGAQVVSPSGVLAGGEVRIADGRITAVGPAGAGNAVPSQEERIDLAGCWLVPGFVDLHMHGGGGHDVTRSAADLTAAVRFHRGKCSRTVSTHGGAPAGSRFWCTLSPASPLGNRCSMHGRSHRAFTMPGPTAR